MPQVDGVVGVSETTLEEARRFYRLEAPSIFVPNGVDLGGLQTTHTREALRRRYDTPQSASVLLFVGNLSRQKRPDRFLRVVADLSSSRDSVYEDCQCLAAELGIADRVRFLGYQDEVASFMTASDVFVSTSDTEGIPAVVIEAGYLGLATVAFRVGGMHECVKDGETGTLVASGDEQALVVALRSLVDSPARRLEMGRNARGWVSQRFSIDAVGRQYEAFYTQLLGNPVSN
jgi:glycosyltransferase involved in cell wall biosynthesis